MSGMRVERRDGAVRFEVCVQPRASRTELVGLHGDAVKVRLTAPPVDGAANAALVEWLADRLRVAPSSVALVRGGRSRTKVVEVRGLTPAAVRAALSEPGP